MSPPADADAAWVRRCLELAARALGRTAPNPPVGCVIVAADGGVLAEGFHARAGQPHAEAVALAAAGERARGATLYVSLEPCAHEGKRRTRPCTPQIVAAGVRRVVYGLHDPFAGHGGAAALAAAGLEVAGPVEEAACRRLVLPFLTWATLGRACFTLKAAVTLDGRIATAGGEARWISGPESRADGHRRRDRVDAILVGAGTVVADDPELTCRDVPGGRDPVRVIVDGRLRIQPTARVLRSGSPALTIIATTTSAPEERTAALAAAGAEVWRLPGTAERIDLLELGRRLGARGLLDVLVEGGGDTHAGFLAAGLCDRLLLYVAPLAIGGRGAPGWLGGDGAASLAAAPRFRIDGEPLRLGDDLLVELVSIRG